MKDIVDKLRELEMGLSKEHGPFALFALVLREDAPDVWDLLAAADWIDEDRPAALVELAQRVRQQLGPEAITRISRVVIVDKTDPAFDSLAAAVEVEHGVLEAADCVFFGLPVRRAYIITSRLRSAA